MTFINKMLFDLYSILLLIIFIRILYKKRYTETANTYIENQFGILCSSSIVIMFVLYVYYYLENRLQIDANYLNGLFLILFFLSGGILTNKFFELYFKSKNSNYDSSSEEYLFLITTSFINITIRLWFDNIIDITTPIVLLLGRLVWLDTKNIQSIGDIIKKVEHKRIWETSVLYTLGTIFVSSCMHYFKLQNIWQLWLSIGYGIIVICPYNFIVAKNNKNF